jgi:tetratricopeptide (TPR) repeat protein
MLDCELFGLKPWGHHLTSVLLHALNAVLVFLVFRRMTGATWRSFFVAALFGLHPLRVESVAWVAERKDVLSTLFWMLTMGAYTRFAEESRTRSPRSRTWYGLALAFFALGLMSKPMLVTLPCVLLLLDYWPLDRFKDKSLGGLAVEKTPFFMLAAMSSVITFMVQRHTGAMTAGAGWPLAVRAENAIISCCRYLGKLFWPENLIVFYPHPGHWPGSTLVLAGVLLLSLSIAAVMLRRRPYVLVGWLWFIGTLVPVLGLVQVGGQSMADRYTYVPSMGILILLAWGAHDLTQRWRLQAVILFSLAAVAMVFCLPLTHRQIGYWMDNETLFRHAIDVTPQNYIAYNDIGVSLHRKGQFEEAARAFREAVSLKPDYATAHYNLGSLLLGKGSLDEAIDELKKAVDIQPNYPEAQNNLGTARVGQKRYDEALVHYREALRLKPDYAEARRNLDAVLEMKRDSTTPKPSRPPRDPA